MSVRISTHPQGTADPNHLPFRFALKAYIKEEKLKIPVLPDVVVKVIELINQPQVDANTLARLIHKDQALAGYVLRVSNSPIYGGSREISTLREAIARIGARTLGKIALSITMQGKMFSARGYESEMASIWRESLTAGALATEIGRAIQYASETLYLCGMLHSVGKAVILQALTELKEELRLDLSRGGGMALVEEFHNWVGGIVAEQWRLPRTVKHAIVYYTMPEMAPEDKIAVRVTLLSRVLAGYLDTPPEPGELDALEAHPSIEALGIKRDEMVRLVNKLSRIEEALEAMRL